MGVLVTGGAGYVGSHLVGRLLQAGHTVRVLDLALASSELLASASCEFVQGSVADRSLVAQAMQGVEVTYHLAWGFATQRSYPQFHLEEERQEIQENLFGTISVLEAALTAGVQHFLFSSSAVVYGPTGVVRVNEEHPCYPERSTIGGSMYGVTKLASEKLCLIYQQRGLPVTIFRLHGVFSEGHLGQFADMIRQALAGEPVRAIREAGGEYTHLEDVLAAFLRAMATPRTYGEVYNLAGSYTYSDPELARYIVEMAHSKSRIELVEDSMQGMISVSVDKLGRVLGHRPEQGEFLTGLIRCALGQTNQDECL